MAAILDALHKALAGRNLDAEEARAALDEILAGSASPALIAALLVALRMKGEAVEEIVGFAQALRDRAVRVACPADPRPLVDTCGTGGDGAQTFNISTATAFVLAAAGARVAKHGNRSISSRCGSADVLEELGVQITLPPDRVASSIQEVGIGFLFAPAFHPAMRYVQAVRAELKTRTIFNLLGPLVNPAGVDIQVVGVADARLIDLVAHALARLGLRRGLVVYGAGGLDEISTVGPTEATEIDRGKVRMRRLTPDDFGVPPAAVADLAGGTPADCAGMVRAVLDGEAGPHRDIVLVNAAAAISIAGLAPDLAASMALARDAIDSGRARQKLDQLIAFTAS